MRTTNNDLNKVEQCLKYIKMLVSAEGETARVKLALIQKEAEVALTSLDNFDNQLFKQLTK